MSCQQCDHMYLFLPVESCFVCPLCGFTTPFLTPTLCGFGENVNVCVYSRAKRFEIMLRALLYPAFDRKDEQVYAHLFTKTYANLAELKAGIKRCPTKEKRFLSVHLFAKLLIRNHHSPKPPTLQYINRVMILFDELLCRFNAEHRTKFFSYPWLIRKLLNITGEYRFDRYIKKIRCKKRNHFYENLFQELVSSAPKTYLIRECGTSK